METDNKPLIILVGVNSNNGKGEFSKKLEEEFNKTKINIIRNSLSTYIRDVLVNDFYWDGEDTPEARHFMGEVYRLGTKLYPYHMARRVWERDTLPYLKNNELNLVIVESFREKNNYDYFKILKDQNKIRDIVTIKVERPNFSVIDDELNKHVSERDLDSFKFDFHILNDSDIKSLYKKAEKVALEILEKFLT